MHITITDEQGHVELYPVFHLSDAILQDFDDWIVQLKVSTGIEFLYTAYSHAHNVAATVITADNISPTRAYQELHAKLAEAINNESETNSHPQT